MTVPVTGSTENDVMLTAGATFATVTVWVAVLLAAPSESETCADTVVLAGPFANVHLKLPAVFVFVSEPTTFVPADPQLVDTDVTVSSPGSVVV
jgi:hypothetical protein